MTESLRHDASHSEHPALHCPKTSRHGIAGKSILSVVLVMLVYCGVMTTAHANPPFQTDDPGVFPKHTGETYLFSSGTHSAGGTTLGAAPGAEINYSFFKNTFAHLLVPLTYNNPRHGGSNYGIGNIELGFKWRFLSQAHDGIDVATFPLVELPTGNASRGLGSHHANFFLPIWIEKNWGPWTVYGGGGRWFKPNPGQHNYWFSGVVVQRHFNSKLYLGSEVFHETPRVKNGPSATGFNIGGGYTFDSPWQVLFSAGRNITDISDNRFSYYLALYRTFG